MGKRSAILLFKGKKDAPMPEVGGIYYTFHNGGPPAPPLVLIHGAGCNLLSWGVEIRRLEGRQVLALDLPGHGRSAGVGLQSIAAYAARVIRFLDALGIYRVVLAGHGMGGAIALELALSHPERLAGAGLVASGASLNVEPLLLENLCHPATLPEALHFLQERLLSAARPEVAAAVMHQLRSARPGVLYNDWLACQSFDRRAEVKRVRVPLRAWVGSQDRMGMLPCAHYLAASLPRLRLRVIPGAGHMLPLERPQTLRQELQAFLNELDAKRSPQHESTE